MKIHWGAILLIAAILIFVVLIVWCLIDEDKIAKQMELLCEDVGGKYDFRDCLIKENGYYQRYDIDWEWSNEKGVREFFLIRE